MLLLRQAVSPGAYKPGWETRADGFQYSNHCDGFLLSGKSAQPEASGMFLGEDDV